MLTTAHINTQGISICVHRTCCCDIRAMAMLFVALVHSRQDYGNSVLVCIPAYLVRRLQSLTNAATPLIFHLKRSDHITDALVSLHWLRVPERIQYEVAVLGYQVLHGSAPRYLGPLTRVADLPGPRTLSFSRHQSSRPAVRQTVHCRQPSFSGCRFRHLDLAP